MKIEMKNSKIKYYVGIGSILYFLSVIKYYYDKITFKLILQQFIILNNCILNYINKFLEIFIKNCFTSSNIKIALIIWSIIYIVDKYNLIDLIKNISSFEFNGLKIESKNLKEIFDSTKKQMEALENEPKKNNEKIEQNKNKLDLIQIMIDDPYIVELINIFINKKIKSKIIPLKVLKCNSSIYSIGKIFEYDIRADSIKIKNIKDDVKDEIVQVYSDLVSNCMI
ncbi:hypothetical protein HYH96_04610 [Clostridium botulinum]|uniref:hypothetical protein n=1 Tax=Clostridium botulinum TaxID=1491 RepID=UPI00174CBA90|nr:hypothetical protein [Clostridium botulinum]MBD5643174.1 hypothetical protein [Clostridium botulinum]